MNQEIKQLRIPFTINGISFDDVYTYLRLRTYRLLGISPKEYVEYYYDKIKDEIVINYK